jgi:hypothetical protein
MIEGLEYMTDSERRDAIWGLRNGCAPHMNRMRRESFESVKALLVDRCARPSKINPPPANVIQISAAPHRAAGYSKITI